VTSGIRIETGAGTDLAHVQEWFSAHRGQQIALDRDRRIELGAPISGARAVLVAVTMQTADASAPELGGVVRALAAGRGGEPALLVFEGRSPAHISDEDARNAAAGVLELISNLAAGRDLVAEVA
jgi:hypothetical protein